MNEFENARKPNKPTLTQEFATAILERTSLYNNDVKIRNLRLNPRVNRNYQKFRLDPTIPKHRLHLFEDVVPPDGWREFMNRLEPDQKRQLLRALKATEWSGFETVGSIRETSVDEMLQLASEQKIKPLLGHLTAVFIKAAF